MKTLLLVLCGFIGSTALVSGILLVMYPDGSLLQLPMALLANTHFTNYQVPGIILAGVVGSTNLAAMLYGIHKSRQAINWSLAGGTVLTCWIIIQMLLLRMISWQQLVCLVIGLCIILAALQLKGKQLI
ncbi:MAG: hypothetical protein RL172_588 [Bacteroidota bacterium]|jgi:hypothetical protein